MRVKGMAWKPTAPPTPKTLLLLLTFPLLPAPPPSSEPSGVSGDTPMPSLDPSGAEGTGVPAEGLCHSPESLGLGPRPRVRGHRADPPSDALPQVSFASPAQGGGVGTAVRSP